jgi:hypothetical protein
MNNNEIIRTALLKLMEERLFSAVPPISKHTLSKRYWRRMNKLFRNADGGRFYTSQKITVKKFVAVIIAVFAATVILTMSVTAFREAFIRFFTELFSTHTVVQSIPDDIAPVTFKDIYEITAGIENHILTENYESPTDIVSVYDNEYSQIRFKQSIKAHYDVNVNSEGYKMERVFINGMEGYYIDMTDQNSQYLSWDNGDYIMTITVILNGDVNIDKNTILLIAESVKKVE